MSVDIIESFLAGMSMAFPQFCGTEVFVAFVRQLLPLPIVDDGYQSAFDVGDAYWSGSGDADFVKTHSPLSIEELVQLLAANPAILQKQGVEKKLFAAMFPKERVGMDVTVMLNGSGSVVLEQRQRVFFQRLHFKRAVNVGDLQALLNVYRNYCGN